MHKTVSTLLIIVSLLAVVHVINITQDKSFSMAEEEYNCNDVTFLTSDEKHLSGEIAKNTKGVVIVPEEQMVVADTKFLEACPNVDLQGYAVGRY